MFTVREVLRGLLTRARISRYERRVAAKAAALRHSAERLDWAREGTQLYI
jgi:hypothetical protein